MKTITTNITLRLETPDDYYAVELLTHEAFWGTSMGDDDKRQICDEHLLVHRLRECEAFVPELNYVAELEGKLAGHIIYSKSKIVDETGMIEAQIWSDAAIRRSKSMDKDWINRHKMRPNPIMLIY